MKSAVSSSFRPRFEIVAENIGYRARIDRKVNEAIWAKLETRSIAVTTAQRSAFKYATCIGVRPIKMLFWEYSDLNPIINGE